MRRNKALLVTLVIAVMLIAIDIGLIFLAPVAAVIIAGLFLLYGLFRSFHDFYTWLTKNESTKISIYEKGDF